MKRITSIPAILFQLIITTVFLYIVFMLFFILEINEREGIIEGLGFERSKTLYAMIIIAITITICFLIGLTIRIISRLTNWWARRPYINIFTALFGLLLVFFYRDSFFSEKIISTSFGDTRIFEFGNPYIILAGWFLIGFSLLHLYPISLFRSKDNKTQLKNKLG